MGASRVDRRGVCVGLVEASRIGSEETPELVTLFLVGFTSGQPSNVLEREEGTDLNRTSGRVTQPSDIGE